jgi:hypothetical protein
LSAANEFDDYLQQSAFGNHGGSAMKNSTIIVFLFLPFVVGQPVIAQSVDSLAEKAWNAYEQKHFVEAATLFELAISTGTKNPIHYYNAACCFALSGRKQKAWNYLEQSVALGYHDAVHMQQDSDLVSLWSEPRWKEFMKKLGANKTTSDNYDGLINTLNNIAAVCYQYRIRPVSMAGGGGAYTGFVLPVKLSSDSNGTYSVLVLGSHLAHLQATSNTGKGTVTCEINGDGRFIESSWKRTGEFGTFK